MSVTGSLSDEPSSSPILGRTSEGCVEWEPPLEELADHESLTSLQERIASKTAELRARGKVLSGRTLLVCHTLPYTCALVNCQNESEEEAQANQSVADETSPKANRPPLEIRHSECGADPAGIHPFRSSAAQTILSGLAFTSDASVQSEHGHTQTPPKAHEVASKALAASLGSSTASTPRSIIGNPFDHLSSSVSSSVTSAPPLSRTSSFVSSLSMSANSANKPKSKKKPTRWVLTPRRGHAALNAGIRALAADGDVTLVAWPGDMRRGVVTSPDEEDNGDLCHDEIPNDLRRELQDGLWNIGGKGKGARCQAVWMEEETSKNFYDGYCKTFLWPVFHYFALSDYIDKAAELKAWNAYQTANQAYADAVVEAYKPGDLIWVHDYHLMLVPRMIRSKIPDASIGFFLHSPFPSSEVFRCLPRRESILDGLLGADLCCFQTWSYGRHFLSSCVRVMGYETASDGHGHVDHRGSITRIMHCPIGVDAERIEQDRSKKGVKPKIEALRELYRGKKIIVGRDKLDPTKGVLAKLQAFERLLLEYPQWVGNTVLIQVTSPSPTESATLGSKVSELVDHINATYGSLHFQPVHHYHQTIDRDEYFALLSVADLALVTSIRDGMNTTSMEYTICQTESKNPLLLSEYCGIATSLGSAIRINPWDHADCARAIDQCLTMSGREKASRHAALYKRVTTHTAAVWAHELVLQLLEARTDVEASTGITSLGYVDCADAWRTANKRLFFFDYDGTLTPIVKVPSAALPSPLLLETLEKMCADPKNVVYIISGRDSSFLADKLGHIKNLGFSAEHGCFLKLPGSDKWQNLTEGLDMSWRKDVEDIFRYYEVRTTGSQVEKKTAAITFHHRNADPTWGEFQAKECQAILESMQARLMIDVMGKRNLEVRPAHTNKGEIVKRLMQQHLDAEFVMCAGDDKTDEDMFRSLRHIQSGIGDNGSVTPDAKATPPTHPVKLPQLNLLETPITPHFPPHSINPDNIFTVVIDENPHVSLAQVFSAMAIA